MGYKYMCNKDTGAETRRGILSLYNPGVFPWQLQHDCRALHTALCKITECFAKEPSHFLVIMPTRKERGQKQHVYTNTHMH